MGSNWNSRSYPNAPTSASLESCSLWNSPINARRIEKADGCLLRSSSGNNAGQRLQPALQRSALKTELLPMRMAFEQAIQHPVQRFSARVQGSELHFPSRSHDFDRRADRSHIPARISLRIFVAGRQINASVTVQLVQQVAKAFLERDGGGEASNVDSARRGVAQGRHNRSIAPPAGANSFKFLY